MLKPDRNLFVALLAIALFASSPRPGAAEPGAGGNPQSNNNSLPKGEIKFQFSTHANNVKVLPPLVADYQLGVCRLTGSGVIKDGKVTGTLDCVDQLRRATYSLKAKIVDGSYSEIGLARILSLTVEITGSSHPTDEAAPGVTGTLTLRDSPALLANGKPDDSVGLGSWIGAGKTHIHGYNNENPGPRTYPPTGGLPNGGQWADVDIGGTAGSISGVWQSNWGAVTLRVHNNNVTGSWTQAGGKTGKITSGTFDPASGALTFKFSQDWNRENGTATLKLSLDRKRLTGTWKHSSGSGTWTMTR